MQNKYDLFIYPRAAQDIDDILRYITETLKADKAALDLIDEMENALDNVCVFPESCPLIRNESVKDKAIRKLIVENYIVFYKPNHEDKKIEVVRVLYGMRNYYDIL